MDKLFSHLKGSSAFYLLAALFAVLQYYRISHLAPPPEYIWDNVYLWDWARSFSHGDFSSFVPDSHHLLRWGNWGFAAVMIELFSDSVLIYYLATIIPSSLAILLFIYYAWRNIGWLGALLFIVLWHYDALLFRATFQLLPSGAALLPVAVLLLLCTKTLSSRVLSTPLLLAVCFSSFWLYGVKETYLAFLPAILWVLYTVGGLRAALALVVFFIVGYLLETAFFNLLHPDFSLLGRVHALVDGGQHVKIMTEHKSFIAQQTQYFDSGITMRWVVTTGVTPIIIFTGFITSLLVMVDQSISKNSRSVDDVSPGNYQTIIATLVISFVVFTTFFVISISPIRLGHGLVPRYATVLLPLTYLSVIGFITSKTAAAPLRYKLAAIAIIPFYIAPSIQRYDQYDNYHIFRISQAYDNFGAELNKYACIRSKQESIVMNQLDLVPEQYRTPRLKKIITDDSHLVREGAWFVVKTVIDKPCLSMYTITRIEAMRY